MPMSRMRRFFSRSQVEPTRTPSPGARELQRLREAFDRYDDVTRGGFLFENRDVYEPLKTDIVVAARNLLEAIDGNVNENGTLPARGTDG